MDLQKNESTPLDSKTLPRAATALGSVLALAAIAGATQGPAPWSEQQKLTASDASGGDFFGHAVSVSGDTALVGATGQEHAGIFSGAAYVYTRSGTDWTEETKLTASDATSADRFGWSVDADGDTAVVGALFGDGFNPVSGTAYVFFRSAGSWSEQAKLMANDGASSDWFARSVSVEGDTIVVGAPQDHNQNGDDAGAAYVFVRSGTNWTQQAKLTASDGAIQDWFGHSVALAGEYVVVGAPQHNAAGGNSGAAYVFKRSGTAWSEEDKLVASDADSQDWFGYAVGATTDRAVVGAYRADASAGSAYVFARAGTTWPEQAELTASDAGAGDEFGWSIAMEGQRVVVGARRDDDGGTDAGAAYVFESDGASWSEEAKLLASDPAADDELGLFVDIDADTAIVGAYMDDDAGSNSGSAYVFVTESDELGTHYCSPVPNSTGSPGIMVVQGSAVVADDNLILTATSLPTQNNLGYFIMGAGMNTFTPPGSAGPICITPGLLRLLPPVSNTNEGPGSFSRAVGTGGPQTGNITPGSTWNFQAWHRDQMAGTSNLTDAVSVDFQ